MSLRESPVDSDPSIMDKGVLPSDWASHPALVAFRICALARIDGRACALRVDAAFAASLMRPPGGGPNSNKEDPNKRASYLEALDQVRHDVGFRFHLALERRRRDAGEDWFMFDSARVEDGQVMMAFKASGERAFVLPFCIGPDERVWSLWSRMDQRHPSFESQSQARVSMVAMAMAAARAFAKHGPAEGGLAMDSLEPLALEFEASHASPPTTPNYPFSKIEGNWIQSEPLWSSVVDGLLAVRQARELARSLPNPASLGARKARQGKARPLMRKWPAIKLAWHGVGHEVERGK
jgi:hypothetical protein